MTLGIKMKMIPVVMMLMLGCSTTIAAPESERFFHKPGPSMKEWRLNTNFDNLDNWEGLAGHENCSKNIYSFPSWYDQQTVVTLPKVFIGKQIILPVNGHFVFQEGITKFLSPGGDAQLADDTCRAREVKFVRASPADWFDPDKWSHFDKIESDNDKGSLLNAKTSYSPSLAVPHVERIPCHYDSVRFPSNSSFNLKISSNVTIDKFYLGNKQQSYTDVAILMNSPLGKLQFRKAPETIFSITDNKEDTKNKANNNNNKNSDASGMSSFCEKNGDSDLCICSNYLDRDAKQKICSLAICDEERNVEDNCPNPITPHGFCCPICGFHMKIRHSGNLRLVPLYSKLKAEVGRRNLQGKVHAHLARYMERGAHLVLLPKHASASKAQGEKVLGEIASLVSGIESILRQESEVIGVTVIESWAGVYPSGGSSDRLAGSSLGAGVITLFVFLALVALLAGIAIALFIWNKKNGYPGLSLSSVTSSLPRMPSIRIPIVPGAGRRSSTLSNSLQSFGFARFTNERVSSVTIGADSRAAGDESGGGDRKLKKSSSIRRTEDVDDQVPEKVTDANSGAYGFSDVTYDLVAGMGEKDSVPDKEDTNLSIGLGEGSNKEKVEIPVFQIPEIKIKNEGEYPEIKDEGKKDGSLRGPIMPTTSSSSAVPPKPKGEGKIKEEGKGGKKLPGFVASRIAKAYQKLTPDEEVHETLGERKVDDKQATEGRQETPEDTLQASEIAVEPIQSQQNLGNVETLVNLEE